MPLNKETKPNQTNYIYIYESIDNKITYIYIE